MKLNWGSYILLFIILFLCLCTAFIVFALRQNHDLVTKNYYEEGAAYSSEIDVRERSAVYLDSLDVEFENDLLKIIPSVTICEMTSTLEVYFYRPSDSNNDFRTELDLVGDTGRVSLEGLNTGRYILKISWLKDDEKYRIEKDIFIE